MTNYSVSRYFNLPSQNSTDITALLCSGTRSVRIVAIEMWATATTQFEVFNYLGATLNGGTVVTPSPLRTGSFASSQVVKGGVSSVSGTSNRLALKWVGSASGVNTITGKAGADGYTFPFNYILTPGNAMVIVCTDVVNSGLTVYINIYFEEQRLAYSR